MSPSDDQCCPLLQNLTAAHNTHDLSQYYGALNHSTLKLINTHAT